MNLKPILISLLFSAVLLLILGPTPVSATVLFEDDFSDSDLDSVLTRWEIPRNTCSNSQWVLSSGRIGIKIDESSPCQTEFAPQDSQWDNWNDYIFEADMTFVSGTDKNIAFRYDGSPNFDWYDYHFQVGSTNSLVILERVYNSDIYSNSVNYAAVNGNTYHLKIIVDGDHLTLYIDDNLVLDYPDAGGRFNTGKIALRAGVGADTSTEVYFDNIKVSSVDTDPVVVIPGMLGSWCKDAITTGDSCSGLWTALPEPLDPYDSLISSLEGASDIGSDNVSVWYYDWRKSISSLSSELSSYIDNTVLSGKSSDTKVRIVGHSYGGLIGTNYTESNPTKVSKLVTAGSPHKGSVQAYGAWEGGELWGFSAWQKLAAQLLLASRNPSFPSAKATIRSEIPSLGDVLPTFDYLIDNGNNTISESSLSQRNTQLPTQYSGLSDIASVLTTMTGLENQTSNTLSSVKVKSRDWISQALGLWEDGQPDEFRYSSEGDLSVLRTSGRYDAASSTPEVTASHVGLISETDGINAILSALGSSGTASITESALDDTKNYALFFLRSPATLSVQFNDQTYTDTDGIVVIPDVTTGDAAITLTGTGNGTYHLDAIENSENAISSTTYSGSITDGQTQDFTAVIDTEAGTIQFVDGQGSIALAFAKGKASDLSTTLYGTTQTRAALYLQSSVSQIKILISRALSQIATPSYAVRTAESTILAVHQFRVNTNYYESLGQIDTTTAQELRSLSYDAIEQLQSSYATLASRAGLSYTASSFTSTQSLLTNLSSQINTKGATATTGKTAGAIATDDANSNRSTGDDNVSSAPASAYINYLSARMYFGEATKILK